MPWSRLWVSFPMWNLPHGTDVESSACCALASWVRTRMEVPEGTSLATWSAGSGVQETTHRRLSNVVALSRLLALWFPVHHRASITVFLKSWSPPSPPLRLAPMAAIPKVRCRSCPAPWPRSCDPYRHVAFRFNVSGYQDKGNILRLIYLHV